MDGATENGRLNELPVRPPQRRTVHQPYDYQATDQYFSHEAPFLKSRFRSSWKSHRAIELMTGLFKTYLWFPEDKNGFNC